MNIDLTNNRSCSELFYPYSCVLNIAGTKIPLALRHKETSACFGPYAVQESVEKEQAVISDYVWSAWLADGGTNDAIGEFSCSTAAVSDKLLKENRCIAHAIAFRYGDSAWLIAGQSGVGKTTQVMNLQSIESDQFAVICGDRPVLQLLDDGSVFVHPSPWNGKENWKGASGAPLAGLVFLERGDEDSFSAIIQKEAVYPALNMLVHTGETEENILNLSKFADRLLQNTPIYKLVSHKVPESTMLIYQELFDNRLMGNGKDLIPDEL